MTVCIDAYAVPANFLEIDVVNPMTSITAGKKRYTEYEVLMRVSVRSKYQFLSSKREPRAHWWSHRFIMVTSECRTHAARHECRPLRLSHACVRLAIIAAIMSSNNTFHSLVFRFCFSSANNDAPTTTTTHTHRPTCPYSR